MRSAIFHTFNMLEIEIMLCSSNPSEIKLNVSFYRPHSHGKCKPKNHFGQAVLEKN